MRKLGMKIAVAAAVFCMAMPLPHLREHGNPTRTECGTSLMTVPIRREDGHGSIRTMMEWQRASILMKTAMS